MIQYGIGLDYLPDWGEAEALREIYQNFNDFGKYEEDVTDKDENDWVLITLKNDFKPKDAEFLRIGNSGKRNDGSKVGEHGEGLKMAMMVLLRNNKNVAIVDTCISYPGILLMPKVYEDNFLGDCFGFDVNTETYLDEFTVSFRVSKEAWKKFKEVSITDLEVLFEDSYHGQVVNKPAGSIYVGGTYVCRLKGYKHAYNFPPSRISLDRDRKIPSSWDVKYHANILVSQFELTDTVADLKSADCASATSVSEKVAKQFKPEMVDGKVKLIAGEHVASQHHQIAILKHPTVAKRVSKLVAKIRTRKKPQTLLKEHKEKYGNGWGALQKAAYDALLIRSKEW